VTGGLRLAELRQLLKVEDPGVALHALIERLYPICRSITGDGVRQTLAILKEHLPLEIHEVPSGTPVLDWVVPREWNVKDAYVKNSRGERVIDYRRHNLHLMGYSVPVAAKMRLAELEPRLFSLPDHPGWIPFRSSFYRDNWAFCLSHDELTKLPDDEYEVRIDSTLEDGSLTYGELFVPGQTADEVLLSAHVCHPSLCNDNLSGISVQCLLARYVSALAGAGRPTRYSYRFVFAPVTIGAVTWLARNEDAVRRVRHGLVLTLLGDSGPITYKRSRRGDATIDRAATHVLGTSRDEHRIQDFSPYGYDERQYCSPGFDLPVGSLMRTPYEQFPEYHTSGDNLDFVRPGSLADSLGKLLAILDVLERDATFLNLSPKGEPQLGRRGLYRSLAERTGDGSAELAMLWVLNQSDGKHSLLEIAERARMCFNSIANAAAMLAEAQLLERL
jgi:aminopeptidase-like protein